jgi:acyl carrier protein
MSLIDQVRNTIATTLKLPVGKITPATGQADLAAWDSLAHVNLMMSLEQEFDVLLDVEDFPRLVSVRAIVDYLERHRDS